jgi:hypothetical protein
VSELPIPPMRDLLHEDLAGLFVEALEPKPNDGAVKFRQGSVVSWDPVTNANTIQVGAALLTDLPALDNGAAAVPVVGDVVGILSTGNTMFILGRIVRP